MFVPDKGAIYEGMQVNNVRMNTTTNSLVDEMIDVWTAVFNIENKGERAFQHELSLEGVEMLAHEELNVFKQLLNMMILKNLNRNSRCFCESGDKYKHCHGKDIKKLLRKHL